ncbi:MAG: hypothetical protein DI626_03510 [Micavibrio aeruginosavorus]|uniref:Uncharacterized protein n=1 Tax=Micavibrio aeruginosavorus TaxID=349221 RepID=A0A2W5A322_9BACT|nr:MAG: hypothetical protein DI626_03510 [Micavibrio aeruginosavorus]
MSTIKASGFGVRFFRRGIQTRVGKSVLQDNVFRIAVPARVIVTASMRRHFTQAAIFNPAAIMIVMRDRTFAVILKRRHAPASQYAVKEIVKQPVKEVAKGKEKILWIAAQNGDCARIRLLVMEGVDLDARDEQGRTALNIATHYNQSNAIKTLMAAKEMLRMAKLGLLPENHFFHRFAKTGTQNKK